MTEDKIKAIAEEYAKNVYGIADYEFLDVTEKAVFSFLSTHYCIVEREKVREKYNEITDINNICDNFLADDRAIFYDLFGTSMFNQDEE